MLQIFKKTYPYYRKIYPVLALCAVMGFVQSVMTMVEPQIISLMVDRVINPALGADPAEGSSIFTGAIRAIAADDYWAILFRLSAILLGFLALYFVTFYTRWNLAHHFSIKCDNDLRFAVLHKINSYGSGLMKSYTSGDLITIVNSDCQKLRNFHIETVPWILEDLFAIVLALYFLSGISWKLMVLPFLTLAVYAVITRGFLKLYDTLYDKLWGKNAELNTETQESIYGIRTIKACGREQMRRRRFDERSEDVRDFSTFIAVKRARYMLAFDSMDQVVMVLSMALSIYLATRFQMTAGEYASFLVYLLDLCNCFVELIFFASDMQDEKVSARRLFGLLEKKDEALEKYGDRAVSAKPHLVLSHLTVYADEAQEKKLVDDVSLDIPFGKKVGIMGKTGCGKSVLLKTLQAFTEYGDGEYLLDGAPSHTYKREEITRTFGYAMQDVFLFSNSIEANIAYYNPDAPQEQVLKCGEVACVDEFAYGFPDGYATLIGEKGFGLSGGQKQRVAIARALLKDAPVTVLDDCTSALDMETESKIFQNLEKHFTEKTLIMATHRAKALKNFDEILFMEDGRIVERGTFAELMARNGHYAAIYRQQMDKEVYISE